MGSDETATATTGGPRVIDVFYGNGAPSGPNYLLFWDADRLSDPLWDRSGVGWSPGPHAPVLGAPQRALDQKLWQIMANGGVAQRTMGDVSYVGSGRACGVGDCPCLIATLGGLGDTPGPRIDRFPPTRPPWWRRQFRELKKLFFWPPSKCSIDLFGPVANGTTLKRLLVLFFLFARRRLLGDFLTRHSSSSTAAESFLEVRSRVLRWRAVVKLLDSAVWLAQHLRHLNWWWRSP